MILQYSDCEYPDFNNFTTHTPIGTDGSLGTGAQIRVQCLGEVNGEKAYFFAQEEHHLMDPVAGITITCNRSRWDFRAVPNCERKFYFGAVPNSCMYLNSNNSKL